MDGFVLGLLVGIVGALAVVGYVAAGFGEYWAYRSQKFMEARSAEYVSRFYAAGALIRQTTDALVHDFMIFFDQPDVDPEALRAWLKHTCDSRLYTLDFKLFRPYEIVKVDTFNDEGLRAIFGERKDDPAPNDSDR